MRIVFCERKEKKKGKERRTREKVGSREEEYKEVRMGKWRNGKKVVGCSTSK